MGFSWETPEHTKAAERFCSILEPNLNKSLRKVPAVKGQEGQTSRFGAEEFNPGSFPHWIFLWHQPMEKGWGNNHSCLEKVWCGYTSLKKHFLVESCLSEHLAQAKKWEIYGISSCHSHEQPVIFRRGKDVLCQDRRSEVKGLG